MLPGADRNTRRQSRRTWHGWGSIGSRWKNPNRDSRQSSKGFIDTCTRMSRSSFLCERNGVCSATRSARQTNAGRLNLRNARYATEDEPLDPTCGCEVCARHSRAYLRHLLKVDEPTAPRLLTLHNLFWLRALVRGAREAILAGTFDDLRQEISSAWT